MPEGIRLVIVLSLIDVVRPHTPRADRSVRPDPLMPETRNFHYFKRNILGEKPGKLQMRWVCDIKAGF